MQAFEKILVGVDLGAGGTTVTAGSQLALRRAHWLAERFGSQVTLVHGHAGDEYWDANEGAYVHRQSGLVDAGRQALQAALEELQEAGIAARLHETDERAALGIVREALRQGADLIVAAKRTEASGDGRRLGSIAKTLLRNAPCAVWLEDPHHPAAPRVVVAATDLSAVGARALRTGAHLAGEFGGELHVVHTYPLPITVQMEGDEALREYQRTNLDRASKEIRACVGGTEAASHAHLHVGIDSPSRAILRVVAESDADLLVMGTVSRGGVPGFLIGNTAERIFGTVDCALLAVKPDDFVCPIQADS